MNKQEIVNKLVTKANFHEYVEICLSEGLSIENFDCFPEIYIYYDDSDYMKKESGKYIDISCRWHTIDLRDKEVYKTTEFVVDGEIMSGTENFFKNYSKITKFIIEHENIKKIFCVKPSLLNSVHWTRSQENYEISFECHSQQGSAFTTIINDEIMGERYYVDGVRLDKQMFLKESREIKFSRILGVDLKAERLEKERLEKEKLEKIEKEKIEDIFSDNDNYDYLKYLA